MRGSPGKISLTAVFIVALFVAALAGSVYYKYSRPAAVAAPSYKTPQEADDYVRFDMEVYDKVVQNYFVKPSDLKLPELFRLSAAKASSSSPALLSNDRDGTAQMLAGVFASTTDTETKKKLALSIAAMVLYNLEPYGRNGLLSQQQEVALRQEVSNINPSKDLYQNLGVEKGAAPAVVEVAYKKKVAALAHATSTEAKQELKQATYARAVLANQNSKALYDQAQVEPTVFGHVLGATLYLSVGKISPSTIREFALAVDAASTTPRLDSMILDLRGNIGGALDFTVNFLGLFMGPAQYAFDLYHQGDYQVQRTTQSRFTELDRYKDIAILTDGMTQSTAEVTTAAFKRFHLARVVGTHTRGWGTVENTYPVDTVIDPSTKYSLLLVNSITLRDDNQSVEGRGVDPDIRTDSPDWKSKLSGAFTSSSLISAIKARAAAPPLTY